MYDYEDVLMIIKDNTPEDAAKELYEMLLSEMEYSLSLQNLLDEK